MLARVESIDKFDNNAIASRCADEEFTSIEASLYQVLRRTTSNEPLRTVQQTRGQKGLEAWHVIARRYDQRNMSDKNSAYVVLISNISEFDDILRTFTIEMNKFENNRFRGTTMSHSELIVALENILVDKVVTVPTARNKKHDTSAPMEIGMAAKEDGENASHEADQRIMDISPQRNWQRKVGLWQLSELE